MTTAVRQPAVAAKRTPGPRRRGLPFSPRHIVLIPIAFVFAVPLLQMFLAAVSPAAELIQYPPPFIPSHLTLGGFQRLFQQSDILLWLGNTVIVSVVAIVSNLVLCSLAGYGFARLKFAGRNFGFFGILATIMIPTQVLMIPTFVMFASVGLTNTLGAAIVPWLASAFGVFLMRQFFLSLPAELEEAGLIDGCNRFQVFWRIVLPLAKPALATLAIFTLLGAWNDLVWPIVAINNPGAFTLQLGIANFQGVRRTDWSLLMAGNVVATLPLIVFFVVAQKQFVATMTFSGLKG
ncbi:MAG: carbohydrate ABC transporter permease [Amnibacterium sp.]